MTRLASRSKFGLVRNLTADRDGDKMVSPSFEDPEIVEDSEPEREHQRQLNKACRRVADSEVIDISDDSDVDGELVFLSFIVC